MLYATENQVSNEKVRRESGLMNLILDHYPSLRQFALEADIPRSSLMTILSRGVDGDSFDLMMQIGR